LFKFNELFFCNTLPALTRLKRDSNEWQGGEGGGGVSIRPLPSDDSKHDDLLPQYNDKDSHRNENPPLSPLRKDHSHCHYLALL